RYYWQLRPQAGHLCRNLIYPVPDPAFPFLGVHGTRRIGTGEVWLGPNAVLAMSREGYRRFDVRPRDLAQALFNRSFQRLARKYWRMGAVEVWRDYSKGAVWGAGRGWLPERAVAEVGPGPSGRPAAGLHPSEALLET